MCYVHSVAYFFYLTSVFSQYGSGYPGVASNGVEGRGFPFYFWLLAWGEGFGYGSAANLHVNEVSPLWSPITYELLLHIH